MIKDNIKNIKKYFEQNPNLEKNVKIGLEYLVNTDFSDLKNGRYPVIGDEVFAIIQEYTSKTLEEGKFESHRKYTDIQFVLSGEEQIGFADVEGFEEATADELNTYDEEKDISFLTPKPSTQADFVKLQTGDFAIFTPKDAHMPSIAVSTPIYVKKIVVKVKVIPPLPKKCNKIAV